MRVLNCSVLSNPASNITWYRTSDIDNITRVVTNMVEDRGENYVAITGKLESGDYFCIARNELGTTREKYISVTVTAKGIQYFLLCLFMRWEMKIKLAF